MRRVLMALALVAAACGGAATQTTTTTTTAAPETPETSVPALAFPPAPDTPTGPLSAETVAALDNLWSGLTTGIRTEDILALGSSGDPRIAWILADLLRFAGFGEAADATLQVIRELTGQTFAGGVPWVEVSDHLIAWDLPEPPGYLDYKRTLYTLVDARWAPFFTPPSDIDYRLLSWGGVLIDDRPLGSEEACPQGCIPALDFPEVTDAAGGDWYPDERYVFGVVIGDEARAYPLNVMEIHEMVNDELGGRRFGLPYCTLCGSAQLFYTDNLPAEFDSPVLRTSGLLSRSNKVMFDLNTYSAFDTFTGEAVTGPLQEAGIVLDQGTVVTSTWGDWKAAHPDTTIVAVNPAITRTGGLDPLGDRDAYGPIFPIGERDPRLPVQEQVLGVILPDGTPVAFAASAARAALASGKSVELADVALSVETGGLTATFGGEPIASHQAFWFAWSQFHPDTLLWEG